MEQPDRTAEAGLFIVLEGADGSGKGTQFRLLAERLKAVGYDVAVFDFPRYEQPSSVFVRNYLNGSYGPAKDVSPYTASIFYALDRFEAAPGIRRALEAGKIVLSNRYAGSNMAHQGGKFENPAQQRGFFVWADSLEYQLLGIPRPTLNIFLDLPAEVSYELISRKAQRNYTTESRDEHEADINHLRQSVKAYRLLCELFPKDYSRIECSKNLKLLNIAVINDLIWDELLPLLPSKKPRKARNLTVNLAKTRVEPQQTPKDGAVRTEVEEKSTAAELRMTLPPISMLSLSTVEEVRGLNIKHIVEKAGARRQFYALNLPAPLNARYKETMARNKQIRTELDKNLTNHPRQATSIDEILMPMSQLARVTLSGPTYAFRQLLNKVEASPLLELAPVQKITELLLESQKGEEDKVGSNNLANDKAPEALQDTLARLAQSRLSTISANLEPVQLMNYWPKNEFELLTDSLYPHTNLSRSEIAAEIADWPYEQKSKALRSIFQQGGPEAQLVRYKLDIICDQPSRRGLILAGLSRDLQTQPPTIRYGYEVPALIEQAGLENLFMEAFDLSLELFSQMQAENREVEAGYVTLQGHKSRLQLTASMADLLLALSNPRPGISGLLEQIIDRVKEVHPIISSSLSAERSEPPQDNRKRKPAKTTTSRRSKHQRG